MKKPIVGVIPLFDEERDSIWMLPGYMEVLQLLGAVPIILPLHMDKEDFLRVSEMVSGYLFTGGHDVSPSVYGEKQHAGCGAVCTDRDSLEAMIYQYALEADKPVLAICRGIQLINALEGGSLYQDLPTEFTGTHIVEHHMEPPYDRTVHKVSIIKDSPLYQILLKDTLAVNSYHHQAVNRKADKLSVMAVSEDGLIEGLYRPDKRFIWGVQWHPEFIYQKDEDQRKIVKEFVRACEYEESHCNDLP